MTTIDMLHRVDAGPVAGKGLELHSLTPAELERVRRGHEALKRRIARANREEDARQMQAALERLAEEE